MIFLHFFRTMELTARLTGKFRKLDHLEMLFFYDCTGNEPSEIELRLNRYKSRAARGQKL